MKIGEFILSDTIEGDREHRFNELMFLLDEMLRQGAIAPTEYTRLNTSLTEAADLRTDEAEKEEDSDDEDDKEELFTVNGRIKR